MRFGVAAGDLLPESAKDLLGVEGDAYLLGRRETVDTISSALKLFFASALSGVMSMANPDLDRFGVTPP